MRKILTILMLVVVASCSLHKKEEQNMSALKIEEYGNMQELIELQNLETRDVVFCFKNNDITAEECAGLFEKKGFVRTKEIPFKTAKFDDLQTDTYPTRRWREGERTPRW